MQAVDPCVECGGTELKLLDGFYYCVECNTQNTNARETVVEQKTLGDGTFALGTRKKIVKIHDIGIQMSGEWYKWHAYNFIILGLADELVAAGAKPTFKLKLLWIWTKYIKKYQNKDALGLAKESDDGNNDNLTLPSFMIEENSSSNHLQDQDNDARESEGTNKNIKKNIIMDGSRRDIKFLSRGVIIAMLYLALNLDESEIQLYHIFRFIKEKRLNFSNIQRFVPEDINLKSIQDEWLKFIHSKVCSVHRVRALAMTLLRKLDLGTPIVPNMRKIIDDFLLELCLPNDIKPMIYSLMFFHRCDFLDISNKSKEHLIQTPDYEGVAMTYILVALKMCFGLDGDYEEKLSDAVDKINDERNLSKSFRMGKYSEPSTRLFSFREWCSYVQFRKITLCKSSLHMAEHHYLDIDDYVYLEHMSERPQNNKELQDETAINLLSKITEEEEGRVIPKQMFSSTLTPMTDYTEIIINHTQDQELRALLSEDFTQYSLNYACQYLELVDTNSENIIKGVSEDRKTVSKVILGTIVTKKSKKEIVYVKNCENRNWMITNPPKMEHVTCEDVQNVSNDKESDHGYDSEHPVNEKEVSRETLNVDDTDQIITKGNRGSSYSENEESEKEVSEVNEDIDITDVNMEEEDIVLRYSESLVKEKEVSENIGIPDESVKEDDIVLRYSDSLVRENEISGVNENTDIVDESMIEDNIVLRHSESRVRENEVSEVNENIDITDESMKEDNIVLRYSESLVRENEISKETGMVYDMADNGSENPAKINRDSKVTENTDDGDESMKKDSRRTDDSESLVNEKAVFKEIENVVDNDQTMDKDIREINYTENPVNEKEVSKETENLVDNDQTMDEDIRGINVTENQVNEKHVTIETENVDNNQTMDENSRGMNDTESAVNETEDSNEIENGIYNDETMDEDIRGINEKPGNEKEVSEEIVNRVQIANQGEKEDKRRFIITEEDSDKNIFDDLFIELDLKDEMEQNNEEDVNADNEDQQIPNNNSVFDDRASISDVTDGDSVLPLFNPDTFDREQTIKELILHACKKYKIPVPKEYKIPKEPKPRKRKPNTFGDEETPIELRKRAKVDKFEAKKKVDELVSGYYSLKESNLINQMQEAVSLAIRNNQFDSLLNVNQNESANLNIEQASDALTRASSFLNSNVENQSNITLQNQSNVNPQSLLDQTEKVPNQDQTDDVEENIDEHWEAKVFEGEEEMKVDDLIPKGDPKFDEEKYDVNQLYIKIKAEEEDDLFNLQDPKLEQILNQKIDQCKDNAQFQHLKPVHLIPVKTKFDNDDSEDEIPLNFLQEEKRLLEEKVSWEDNFEPLLNKENVLEFKYWFRHYDEDFMTRSMDWHKKFDEELKENTPSSFYFVIRECAAILDCTTFSLYKHMQNLEKYIRARAKYTD